MASRNIKKNNRNGMNENKTTTKKSNVKNAYMRMVTCDATIMIRGFLATHLEYVNENQCKQGIKQAQMKQK